jgi:chitodextrinase
VSLRAAISAVGVLAAALTLILATAADARRPPPPPPPPPPPSGGQPPTPTNLRITATTDTSISLAWDAPSGNSGNWWYCLQRDGQGCIRIDPPATTYLRTGLWPSTTFNYSLVAVSFNGQRSGSSNTVTYTTPPDVTPPSTPTLTQTGVWPVRVALSWTVSTDNVSQVWYTLLVNGEPHRADQIGWQSALVLDRTPSTGYTFQITVRDYFGNTAASNVVSVTTPAVTDFESPTAPTNLSLSFQSDPPEIWLNWDQSTDNSDPQSLILYDVYINGVFLEHSAVGYGATVTYCQGEGPNRITMRAVDTSGNASGFSNEIVFC